MQIQGQTVHRSEVIDEYGEGQTDKHKNRQFYQKSRKQKETEKTDRKSAV